MEPITLGLVLGLVLVLIIVGGEVWSKSRQGRLEDLAGQDSAAEAGTPQPKTDGVLERFRAGLARTTSSLGLSAIFGRESVDEALFEELETALISADVGIGATTSLLDTLRKTARERKIEDAEALRQALIEQLKESAAAFDPALNTAPGGGPLVILVVGVNGAGKTTTIGKLAHRFKQDGKKVLLGAESFFQGLIPLPLLNFFVPFFFGLRQLALQ